MRWLKVDDYCFENGGTFLILDEEGDLKFISLVEGDFTQVATALYYIDIDTIKIPSRIAKIRKERFLIKLKKRYKKVEVDKDGNITIDNQDPLPEYRVNTIVSKPYIVTEREDK